ncbi:hypothetical protein F5Y18DRAFT_304696 [Xylariaceae sp. FL1019]|nr:hypothetical protein F5Y18DRAFT_304696 [Xylariaceae sp. FL1019]
MSDPPHQPFFVHPYAHHAQSASPSSSRRDWRRHALVATHSESRMMAEMRVSLAVTHLSDRIKKSNTFWHDFRDEYEKDVDNIKIYAGADILQQIWQKKVGQKKKHANYQAIGLESCLQSAHNAAKLLAANEDSQETDEYSSQHKFLGKVRSAGDVIVGLNKLSYSSESACKDFQQQLSDLDTLVQGSGFLNRFDRLSSQQSTNGEEADAVDPTADTEGYQDSFANGD